MRDLHDLYVLVTEPHIAYTILRQVAQALHDEDLDEECERLSTETHEQLSWLQTRIKQAALQALIMG